MNLTYTTADVTDITPIYQFCKKLIDTYENLQTIPYDKVLNWVRTKIETNIHEYQCIWLNGQKVGYYHFFQNGEKMELDNEVQRLKLLKSLMLVFMLQRKK